MLKSQNEIAIVAVAKDEAAYVHEWIHHHLYFGFSHIFIGVNRTTDQTRDVLAKIQQQYPNIYFFDVDWIDQARPTGSSINEEIQFISYAYLIDHIRQNFGHIPFCLPLDVDEFWFPENFEGSITEWLENAPYFDTASFYWACQFGDKQAFAEPFENRNARLRGQIKSIINMQSQHTLDRIRAHSPYFKEHNQIVHIDANGRDFSPKQGLKAEKPPTEQPCASILHRMTRSEVEYVSNLQRGMLETNTPIKINRNGYWHTSDQHLLELDQNVLDQYHASLGSFIQKCNLETEIEKARAGILNSAGTILDANRQTLIDNSHHYCQTLHGTKAYEDFLMKLKEFQPFSQKEEMALRNCYKHLVETQPSSASGLQDLLET